MQAKKKQKEEEWAKARQKLEICCQQDKVAYFPLTTKSGEKVKVLLDDNDWLDIHAQNLHLIITRQDHVQILVDGQPHFLSRWLLNINQNTKIVDHLHGNIYDHHRNMLQAGDYLSSRQNSRLAHRNKSGFIGVCVIVGKGFITVCSVRNKQDWQARHLDWERYTRRSRCMILYCFISMGPELLSTVQRSFQTI